MQKGLLTFSECSAYLFMIVLADHETGVWHGSAKGLEFICGLNYRQARHLLEKLESSRYLKRFAVQGKHGNYPILINKYEISRGNEKFRINATDTVDWKNPVLESCFDDGNEHGNEHGNERSPSQEERTKKQKSRSNFNKPTIDEVREYILSLGMNGNSAENFMDYYTANGWRVGRNPMKDWKAAVRTWKRNSFGGNGNGRYKNQCSQDGVDKAMAKIARELIQP